ncbi:hypothetical protein PHMEG_00034862 [Phytophthora megakarya]|uniref:DDE-1 domain-containing protein n=1 Tax=Phytophthora megakarya TaxID=4795 RepID=A0A225UPW6_9STRA|nr:hypothetical protein PHMEG_00034862 [Phytophthora megakarya]
MLKWIEEIWTPSIQGCRMLMLDSLRVHKMVNIKDHLEDFCCTKRATLIFVDNHWEDLEHGKQFHYRERV